MSTWRGSKVASGEASLRFANSGYGSFNFYSVSVIRREIQQYEQTGTVIGAITRRHFHTLPTMSPTDQLVSGFETFVLPLGQPPRDNITDSRSLPTRREALLHRLVS